MWEWRSVKICSVSIYLLQVLQLSWSEETAGTRESGWATAVVAAAWEAGFWGASPDPLEPGTPVSMGELQGWTLSQAFFHTLLLLPDCLTQEDPIPFFVS